MIDCMIEWSAGQDEDYSSEDDAKVYKNPRNSPSAECPRDEEHAEFLGQKCLRKCSNDEDCKSKKKKCLCDGVCGMSCIKPERECEELGSPALGSVTIGGRLFGDRASYICDPGYTLVGLKERICQGDGNWSGAQPQCRHNVYCKTPPELEHARHNGLPEQATFPLDTTLQYQCNLGYVTNGFPKAKCLAIENTASWFGPDISCEPRSCGAPMDPSNGWHSGDCYTYSCKVTYHCGEGYELVGRLERICQAEGIWGPRDLPACVLVTAVECPMPENPQFGTAIYTSCGYNAVVSYECRHGYTLVGDSTRRCGADRKWSGSTPKCQVVDCGHPGNIYNGWIENLEKGTGLGASVIFRCSPGMTLVGNTSSVCQIDGTWRYPPPLCLASCVVPAVAQGRILLEANGSMDPLVVPHGHQLSVQCEQRYEPAAESPIVCNNGSWSQIPRCQPARCKYLPKAPKNGMVIAPKTQHGMKARFKCRDGYVIKGQNTSECRYGNWTGEQPYCQEVYCPFPGYVENGKVLLVGNMGLYDYRPYVRKVTNNKQIMYECNKGYTLAEGPPGATCIAGHWSPKNLPRCVPGLHPRLRWTRKKRALALIFLRRAKRALSASAGTVIKKPQNPSSNKQDSTLGGSRKGPTKSGGSTKGSDDVDEEETEKTEEGKKTGSRRKKKQDGIPCEDPGEEPNGKLDIIKNGRDPNNTWSQGTMLRLTCSTGFVSNLPNGTARCTRGKWKPAKPQCSLAPCKIPESKHGIYTAGGSSAISGQILNLSAPVPHDHVIEFSCRVGYNVQGNGRMRCWHGQWNVPVLPTCTPAPCQLPVVSHGQYLLGYRPGLTIGNGSIVRFQCDTEFKPSGSETIVCVLGELRPKSPHCKPDPGSMFMAGGDITKAGEIGEVDYLSGLRGSCSPPQSVRGTLAYKNGEPLANAETNFPDGTEVTFNCITSIMGEKTTWRIICQDGNWLGHPLHCEVEDNSSGGTSSSKDNTTCLFKNTEPNVATFYMDQPVTEDSVEFPFGAVLTFRCTDIGKFAIIGTSVRKCVDGEWDGQRPSCFGLNQENDYALEKPPTILFRHESGPIAQSNDGKMIIYPGTTLHMECLWIRRFGTPKWAVSHEYRKYEESWSSDPGRDSQLEYRLTIADAVPEDSGTYTCITPTRHSHSVELVVKAVHCSPLPNRRGLKVSTEETKMGTTVFLNCQNGNSLIGAHQLICLPSGNWSSPLPVCESMECPDLTNLQDANLRSSVLSREVGGRVVFSCGPGHALVGPSHSTCQASGEWAQPFPTCKEVECGDPGRPENGWVQGGSNGVYKAGDLATFTCATDFMMEGQPVVACQENGRWSASPPNCVKACSYPGTVISGRMSLVKFYYSIDEVIEFRCDEGLIMSGPAKIRCLKTGKWSGSIPVCRSQTNL
nr:sushi, von Willebrand factor type A, EGF and pentraxin domain-containing protein 1 isoform X2 [Halyomorpha halys]